MTDKTTTLDDARSAYYAAREALAAAHATLDDAREALDDAREAYCDARETLAAAHATLDDARSAYLTTYRAHHAALDADDANQGVFDNRTGARTGARRFCG